MTDRGSPSCKHHGSHLSPWRYICQNIGLTDSCFQHHIGDGTTTFFWIDPWLSCGILATSFTQMFHLALCPTETVADVWIVDSDSSDLHLCRNINYLKLSEWDILSDHLTSVWHWSTANVWIWPMHHCISSLNLSWLILLELMTTLEGPLLIIWKAYLKKIKIFLRELKLGAINTYNRLRRHITYALYASFPFVVLHVLLYLWNSSSFVCTLHFCVTFLGYCSRSLWLVFGLPQLYHWSLEIFACWASFWWH